MHFFKTRHKLHNMKHSVPRQNEISNIPYPKLNPVHHIDTYLLHIHLNIKNI